MDCTNYDESLEQKSTEVLSSLISYSKKSLSKCFRERGCITCDKLEQCKYKHSSLDLGISINDINGKICKKEIKSKDNKDELSTNKMNLFDGGN